MIINSAEYKASAAHTHQYPDDNLPEFLLSGRSNVGKSSFINSVLNRKKLAYVSSKPGKTQTLNFYLINEKFYFVDVPGYGYASVSRKQREEFGKMIEKYLTTRENLKLIFLLVDFRHDPSEDDIIMYDYLKYYEIPVCVIATKVDKIGKTHRDKHERNIKQKLKFDNNDTFIRYSSETMEGLESVHKMLWENLK